MGQGVWWKEETAEKRKGVEAEKVQSPKKTCLRGGIVILIVFSDSEEVDRGENTIDAWIRRDKTRE